MRRRLVFLIGSIFVNYWIWEIFEKSVILGISIVTVSFLLGYLCFTQTKVSKRLIFLRCGLFALTLFIFVSIVKNDFDKNILRLDATEEKTLIGRHWYYSIELGDVYTNKFLIYYYNNLYFPFLKIEKNLFNNLDPNLFFFGGHPRERGGIQEFNKFPFIFLPLFCIGLFCLIIRFKYWVMCYFLMVIILSAFINPAIKVGPVLFFPLIILLLNMGFIYVIHSLSTIRDGL